MSVGLEKKVYGVVGDVTKISLSFFLYYGFTCKLLRWHLRMHLRAHSYLIKLQTLLLILYKSTSW